MPIDGVDIVKINKHFEDVDYMNNPNPRKLLHTVLFNIMCYTCRRGLWNLENMTLVDHYKFIVEPDGTCYVIQNTDELDKNHREDDISNINGK